MADEDYRRLSWPCPCTSPAIRRIARGLSALAKRRASTNCECSICGAAYERQAWQRYGICRSCSAEKSRKAQRAAKSAAKATRRMRVRRRAEPIDPIKIFARDKWHCQLCGCHAPAKKRGTFEPDAPELDHIISLAEGGEHVSSNVQCACRSCNISKGAKSRGQLLLAL